MDWNRVRGQLKLDKKTVWDQEFGGLGIRFNKKGSAVYVLKYALKGKQVMDTLGDVDFMTKDQARQLAYRMKALAKQGVDPTFLITSYITTEGIHPGSVTFGELCKIYMDRHAREHKRSWIEDERRIKRHLTPWFGRRLNTITKQDVSKLHFQIGKKTPTSANRMIEQLGTMFLKAVEWGYLPDGYPNPAKGISRYDEESRERFLDQAEMARLGKALAQCKNHQIKSAVKLYSYTALRRMELLSLKWENVDLIKAEIVIIKKRSKNKKTHYLPISPQAVKVLETIKRTNSPYVFPGQKGGHMSASVLERAWRDLRHLAKLDDVWLHDLRRTAGSWIAQRTGNIALVGQVLNHTNEHTTATYARFSKVHVRTAVDMLAQDLSQFLDITETSI